MLCRIFGHDFEKFVQFDLTPSNGKTSIDMDDCDDEDKETYKKTITAFICHKCGLVKDYHHNFTKNKETK